MSYAIEKINGVTKMQIDSIAYSFQYDFPTALITVNTESSNIKIQRKTGNAQPVVIAYSDLTDNLGAANIEEYADALANQGFFFDSVQNEDYRISRAVADIQEDYGELVSVSAKNKVLRKWGSNENVQTTKSVIMTMQSGVQSETMLSSNGITTVISSSSSDTQDVDFYEGHTISGSDLTFAIENTNQTLTGMTAVTLSTALARATIARLTSPAVGNIYFYEGGATTNGVPNDGTKTHLIIPAGEIQSQKLSTSTSSIDYWLVTGATASILQKSNSWCQVRIETKAVGSTYWIPATEWIGLTDTSGTINILGDADPILIIPKNTDVRMVGIANIANVYVAGGMVGYLAKVVG
jgi:hypothetical protein